MLRLVSLDELYFNEMNHIMVMCIWRRYRNVPTIGEKTHAFCARKHKQQPPSVKIVSLSVAHLRKIRMPIRLFHAAHCSRVEHAGSCVDMPCLHVVDFPLLRYLWAQWQNEAMALIVRPKCIYYWTWAIIYGVQLRQIKSETNWLRTEITISRAL